MLYSANGPANDVSVVDLATEQVIKKIKVSDRPWGVLGAASLTRRESGVRSQVLSPPHEVANRIDDLRLTIDD